MMALCTSKPENESRNCSHSQSASLSLQQRYEILKAKQDVQQREVIGLKKRISQLTGELEIAKAEIAWRTSQEQPAVAPVAPLIQREMPMFGFQFNLSTIALAIELGKRVGFRAAAEVLQMVIAKLGLEMRAPSHDVIEHWTLRFGVGLLNDTFSEEDRVLWMVDHSNQIGKERVLLIVGVALADLPPSGQTLTLDRLKVLAVVPGESWKKEDVEREYLKLAKQIGVPVVLLCDGAAELREPAEKLENNGRKTIVLGDLKHVAANLLEKELRRGGRFQAFLAEVGLTRNRVQQTELDQFTPPTLRSKSRFMNLGPLLKWGTMVLYHLNTPDSEARKPIDAQRMTQKLGWLHEYAADLELWNQCQAVIDHSLSVVNCHGLDVETEELIEQSLSVLNPNWRNEDSSATRIAVQLLECIEKSAAKLQVSERAWLSTEILESLFGKYKQVERQHSKGGFTRLIAAIPTLCVQASKQMLRKAFEAVDSKQLQHWIHTNLGKTLTARRNAAYRESEKNTCNRAATQP